MTTNTVTVYIANNPESLASLNLTATVEAEFGAKVVEGKLATLAHHGPREDNPAPCMARVERLPSGSTIGVSHFDLDTLGGVMRLLGHNPASAAGIFFWEIAAAVDVRGPHRLTEICEELGERISTPTLHDVLDMLNAFWAWSQNNRLFPPRDGSAMDCTEFFLGAIETVKNIFEGDKLLIDAGRQWAKAQEKLNEESFVSARWTGWFSVVVRKAESFVNHLYDYEGGACVADVVLALNTKTGAITISKASPNLNFDCCAFMQKAFGPEAGGHKGIAGTPRDKKYTEKDLFQLVKTL